MCILYVIVFERERIGFVVKDLIFIERHDDISNRHNFATKILPFLKDLGYSRIGLEGFSPDFSLDQMIERAREEIRETISMIIPLLAVDDLANQCGFNDPFFNYPDNHLKDIHLRSLNASFLKYYHQNRSEDLTVALQYLKESIVNHSLLQVLLKIKELGLEAIPLDDPESLVLFQEALTVARSPLVDESIIDSMTLRREAAFASNYQKAKSLKQGPMIVLIGAAHYRAIESTATALVLMTSNQELRAGMQNFVDFTSPVKIILSSDDKCCDKLKQMSGISDFLIRHFNEPPEYSRTLFNIINKTKDNSTEKIQAPSIGCG